MQSKKAIIIGSGVAGMATAIRLATDGYATTVFEANDYPGGKLSFFEKNGYRFDAGPSLFTQPQNIVELFEYAQEPIDAYFNYQQVDVSCRYFFENGKQIIAYTDRNKLSEELQLKLNEDSTAINNYLNHAEDLYQHVGSIFLNHSLHRSATWLKKRVWKALTAVKLSHLLGSLNQHNQKSFQSEEAVQIFNRYATYNGSNPYKAPGMLSLIPHLELNEGTFYPQGGMISITNALYQLALKKGVQFKFNHLVEKILHQNKKITGIVANGQSHDASIVISNGDVYHTYKDLLNDHRQVKRLEKLERSSSALIFYWGIKQPFQQLGLHNILFSKNYQAEFEHLFQHKTLYKDPTVYINITSKMEDMHAPKHCENWFVMINAPTNEGQYNEDYILQAKENILLKLKNMLHTDISDLIETETIMDPVSISQKTKTYKGSLYGTSSNSKLSAFFRPANFSNHMQGLYFCGGTVHPGGGIPLCLKSAQITASLISQSKHD